MTTMQRERPPGLDLIRDAIRAMSAYTLEPRVANDKLDQNESAFDIPDDIKRAVAERIVRRGWNLYPDFEAVELREAIARRNGMTAGNILVGNGSNELLMVVMATLVAPGRRLILPVPTFPLYEKLATIFGGSITKVPIDIRSGVLPVRAVLDLAEESPEPPLVVICSPNNPTGGVLAPGDLARLLASGAFVLLDRAYGEFWDEGCPPPVDRLVVLSTFSKAWGLAALRIGWLASTIELCAELRKVKLPYNLNTLSQEAALTVLGREDILRARVEETVRERQRLVEGLASIADVEAFPSHANFVTFRIGSGAGAAFDALRVHGVLVRDVSAYPGLDGCLRVSVGSAEQNDRFITALRQAQGPRIARSAAGEGGIE
jgi:histidinol-phosphate aminotransferase